MAIKMNKAKKAQRKITVFLQINGNECVPEIRVIWFQAALDIIDY